MSNEKKLKEQDKLFEKVWRDKGFEEYEDKYASDALFLVKEYLEYLVKQNRMRKS